MDIIAKIVLNISQNPLNISYFCFRNEPVLNHLLSVSKFNIGFLNLKEFGNVFCVSLLNRSVQDLSHHDASKEQRNPLRFLRRTMIRETLD